MNERKLEKARKKELAQAIKAQERDRQSHREEQQQQEKRTRAITAQETLKKEMDAFISATRERRQNDPEYNRRIAAQVAMMTIFKEQLENNNDDAWGNKIIAQFVALLNQDLAKNSEIYNGHIKYPPKAAIKELARQKQLHDAELGLALSAYADLANICTDGNIVPQEALNKALAILDLADKKSEIEDIDN